MAVIDLRSDTVTRPSAAMRRAMAEAEVGDDVFLEDPTLNRLQDRAAEIFGREAALFVPSGSMGNLACVMAQTHPGQEVICETNGHIYNYEMGALSALAGVLPRVVEGEDGRLSWDAIAPAIRPRVYYRPRTTLICLENTVNMAGGTVYPTRTVNEICERAHEQGIHVHLDGARVFNAATYLNEDVAAMTRNVDSVQFCLSKGLGAPVGSVIVGTRDFVERCRPIRKMLGGGMRQAGVLAAAGLVALEHGPKRLRGGSRQCAAVGGETVPDPRHRSRRVQSADQYRHLQREVHRDDVSRISRENCRGGRAGGAGRHAPHPHGDPSRRVPGRHRKSRRHRRICAIRSSRVPVCGGCVCTADLER